MLRRHLQEMGADAQCQCAAIWSPFCPSSKTPGLGNGSIRTVAVFGADVDAREELKFLAAANPKTAQTCRSGRRPV